MKSLIAFLLVLIPELLIAQNHKKYEPIDSVGWELPVISELDINPETDSGSVTYLLTVGKDGLIRNVKILSNTFSEAAESKVRNEVKGLKLSKKESRKNKPGAKGTLEISVATCASVGS